MGIAILGMACRYPDAPTPERLWENILAQRRAFRKMPPCRLNTVDYLPGAAPECDTIATERAAVLEEMDFDRARFGIPGSVFRGADPVHWLALQVAAEALDNAGFGKDRPAPKDTTAVYLGNTLTGEVTRSRTLRQRWPYVRRTLAATLQEQGKSPEEIAALLAEYEPRYKAAFEEQDDESLAGGLSNTIAGRICGAFDFHGGGYVVDAACASSLLAVANACSALAAGDVDMALAGGVDVSLDPFELVGFARVGAITKGEMKVYDANSSGFLPGEGCGFVVLMREEDALAQGIKPIAVIRGWGISSDGQGSITRPEVAGQQTAMHRAYKRAGYDPASVLYFEGHGTGTAVGDRVEITALSGIRDGAEERAALGSVKANIGHTKAAAGIAGLLKATLALQHRVLPPTTGVFEPHDLLAEKDARLRVLRQPEPWPTARPVRAGVSALGFGGINLHVTLEADQERDCALSDIEQRMARTPQDAELLLLTAPTPEVLRERAETLARAVAELSQAEWTDLACQCAAEPENGPIRAAIVARTPQQAANALDELARKLESGIVRVLEPSKGIYLGDSDRREPIGLLFPGQGAPLYADGGALGRRFDEYRPCWLPTGKSRGTDVAQPAITAQCLEAWNLLERFRVTADTAVGHSLGELCALCWAGAFGTGDTLRLAQARGRAMAAAADCRSIGRGEGGMLSVNAGLSVVSPLLRGLSAVISGHNAPLRTVVSGPKEALAEVEKRATAHGLTARMLPVAGAFHSPDMEPAIAPLSTFLRGMSLRPLTRPYLSTITGDRLCTVDCVPELLCRQLIDPVRFLESVTGAAARPIGVWIEVGPGKMLSALLSECRPDAVAIPTDAGGESVSGLLHALGAAFVVGQDLDRTRLYADRFYRPIDLTVPRRFIENPCERAPDTLIPMPSMLRVEKKTGEAPGADSGGSVGNALEAVRIVVARVLELPMDAVQPDASLSRDFRLSSLKVSEIVDEAARLLGACPPAVPLEFANATVAQIAEALENLSESAGAAPALPTDPAGVAPWIRQFLVEPRPKPLATVRAGRPSGTWQTFGDLPVELREWLESEAPGAGVLVKIDLAPETAIPELIAAGKAALALPVAAPFILVTENGSGAGFARSLAIESPERPVRVIHSLNPELILAEVRAAAPGYQEAIYANDGARCEPALLYRTPIDEGALPLTTDDVLLVTGGGKGIGAECALALAQHSGVKLALIGRSEPQRDVELAANLKRLAALGATVHYAVADVTDREAVRRAVAECEATLGKVTGVLHSAGINHPCRLADLAVPAFEKTMRPKVEGLRNILSAVDGSALRLLISFGSIIGRTGLIGEADYAASNEWLRLETERFGVAHPACNALTIEWSVWSGIGMGEKLGMLNALERQGITPISPEEGVRHLLALLRQGATGSVVVAGRYGSAPTLAPRRTELPPLRFIERVRAHYPSVELIADAELSAATDPYLEDHKIEGTAIFPGVMGLEAMAQAASALAGHDGWAAIENVSFAAPVRVPDNRSVIIRIAALQEEDGTVRVALRSSETEFTRDHFTATFRPKSDQNNDAASEVPDEELTVPEGASLSDAASLYDSLFFQRGRFRRVLAYDAIRAFGCRATIERRDDDWFSEFLPPTMLLGDAGARDACLHALQVCIPYRTLVPVGIRRIVRGKGRAQGPLTLTGVERDWQGDRFVYDLEVRDALGLLVERCEGLTLAALPQAERPVPSVLLAGIVERIASACCPGAIEKVIFQTEAPTSDGPTYRPDGKPDGCWSRSHSGDFTLAVAAAHGIGCDVEGIPTRDITAWEGLLGREKFALARAESGDVDTAATRIWTIIESLAKSGQAVVPSLRPCPVPEGLPETSRVFTTGIRRTFALAVTLADNGARMAVGLAVPERY